MTDPQPTQMQDLAARMANNVGCLVLEMTGRPVRVVTVLLDEADESVYTGVLGMNRDDLVTLLRVMAESVENNTCETGNVDEDGSIEWHKAPLS